MMMSKCGIKQPEAKKLHGGRRGGISGMRALMRKERLVEIFAIYCFAMILGSCAGLWPERIGGIVPDRGAMLIFERKQCSADYQYYYSGSVLFVPTNMV
jgi:hypothetical protein